MRGLLAGGAITLMLVLSIDAIACRNDTECPTGTRCARKFGETYGVCESGIVPTDRDGWRRRDEPALSKGGEGAPCKFPSDCSTDLTCVVVGEHPDQRVCSR